MITLNAKQRQAIKEHTLACYPEEMCGILSEGEFIPFKNIAAKPKNNFRVSERELIKYLGRAEAVVHSHCYDSSRPSLLDIRTPSVTDIKQQKLSGVPWLIVGTEGLSVLDPIEIPRVSSNLYLGRPFMWYINDCYTLVQDYYKYELGIDLPEEASNKDYKETRNLNKPFEGYIEEYGFARRTSIEDMQDGDLILIDSGIASQNHLGIFHRGNVLSQDSVSTSLPFHNYVGRIHLVLRYVK